MGKNKKKIRRQSPTSETHTSTEEPADPMPRFDAMEHKPKTTEIKQAGSEAQKQLKTIFQRFKDTLFTGKSGAWTAASTVVVTLFTGMLYLISSRTERHNVATERAFLYIAEPIDGVKNVRDQNAVESITFTVRWENSGATPAKTVTGLSSLTVTTGELPPDFEFKVTNHAPVPATVAAQGTARQSLTIPIDKLYDVYLKKQRLYIWGWMAYRDVFDGTQARLSEFCVELVRIQPNGPVTDFSAATTSFAFTFNQSCGRNCIDEDCSDYTERTKSYRD